MLSPLLTADLTKTWPHMGEFQKRCDMHSVGHSKILPDFLGGYMVLHLEHAAYSIVSGSMCRAQCAERKSEGNSLKSFKLREQGVPPSIPPRKFCAYGGLHCTKTAICG